MNRVRALSFVLAVACAPLAAATAAHAAEPTAVDAENALQLYKDGKALRERGDLQGALGKFRAAHALVETPITALELGRTYITLGQLIEAREVLLGVARMPVRKNESTKATEARSEAERVAGELRPKLASLTLRAPPHGGDPVRITVDGQVVPPPAMGSPRLVNPGKHLVVLEVGSEVVRSEVTLAEGEARDVALAVPPQAAAVPPGQALVAPPPVVAPDPTLVPPAPQRNRTPGARNAVMIGGFGAAAVSVAVGSITGILTLSRAGTLKDACTTDGRCPASAKDDLDSASTLGTVSTVMFGVALVGVAVGAAGYLFLGPGNETPQVGQWRLAPTGTGLIGTF